MRRPLEQPAPIPRVPASLGVPVRAPLPARAAERSRYGTVANRGETGILPALYSIVSRPVLSSEVRAINGGGAGGVIDDEHVGALAQMLSYGRLELVVPMPPARESRRVVCRR